MIRSKDSPAGQQFKMAPSMKIGYVSLNVSDLGRSLDFYQSVLGFKSIARPSDDRALLSAAGGSSPHLLELQQVKAVDSSNSAARRAGLYHLAILLPERKYLADMLRNLSDKSDQEHFDGLADHLVSESIYIRDPDYIGIEIYRDRPISEWKRSEGMIQIATLPLDTDNLLGESTNDGWKELPAKTTIGHVHLHVTDLDKAIRFYREILGLNLTATIPSAAFFAAGSYHHHIGANTWLGEGIAKANPQGIGLNHFSIELPGKEAYEESIRRLSSYGLGASEALDKSPFVHDLDGIKIKLQHKWSRTNLSP